MEMTYQHRNTNSQKHQAYNIQMDNGFGFIIFIGIIFLAWLMWSSKLDKEVFLFYGWAAAALIIVGQLIYLVVH